MDNSPVLFCWEFNNKGGGNPIEGEQIGKLLKSKTLAWAHLDATNKSTKKWLKANIDYLDDIILDALLAEETRPRMFEVDKGILLILRGVNLNKGADPEDMVSIRLWIDSHRIISVQRRPITAIGDIANKLKIGKGPKGSGDFLIQLVSQMFDRMEPVLNSLDDATDEIEETIIDDPNTCDRQTIVDIRKKAILFRRYISPQRDVMLHLRSSEVPWLNALHKRHLQENYDKVLRYTEDLDAIRERSQVIKDELTNTLSDKLNKNMYTLSVIAAIFLPLSFLTGLLGINVGGIPGADNPLAFWIFMIIVTLLVIIQVFLFKKLKWF